VDTIHDPALALADTSRTPDMTESSGTIADLVAWTTRHDEAAFRRLVERYSGLVNAVCRRQFGNSDRADEATQAVFIIFAKRAGSVSNPQALASWLHEVALSVCRDSRRAETRRNRYEQGAAMHATDSQRAAAAAPLWADLRPFLDDAIANLKSVERDLVIAHFLHGLPQAAVAARLGMSENAAQKRITTALGKLRTWFDRRGIPVGMSVLVAGLAGEVQASESALTMACTKAALYPTSAAAANILATSAMGGGVIKMILTTMVATMLVGTAGVIIVNLPMASPEKSLAQPAVVSPPVPPAVSQSTQVVWGGDAKGRWLGRDAPDGVSAQPMGEGEPHQQISTVKTAQRPLVGWTKGLELRLDLELGAARTITVFMVLDDAQGNWAMNLQHQVSLPAGRSSQVVIKPADMHSLQLLDYDSPRRLLVREIAIHADAATLLLRTAAIVVSSSPPTSHH